MVCPAQSPEPAGLMARGASGVRPIWRSPKARGLPQRSSARVRADFPPASNWATVDPPWVLGRSAAAAPAGEAVPAGEVVPAGEAVPAREVVPAGEVVPVREVVPVGEVVLAGEVVPDLGRRPGPCRYLGHHPHRHPVSKPARRRVGGRDNHDLRHQDPRGPIKAMVMTMKSSRQRISVHPGK